MRVRDVIARMHNAVCLCCGIDGRNGSQWFLYGILDEDGYPEYFTIEIDLFGQNADAPYIVPCDHQAAAVLYDDAWIRHFDTLDVKKIIDSLQGGD